MLVAITKQVDDTGVVGNEYMEIHNPPHNIKMLILDSDESLQGIHGDTMQARVYKLYSELEPTIRNLQWPDWAVAGLVTELSTADSLELTYKTLQTALTSPTISLDYILIPGELISKSATSKVPADLALDLCNNIWLIQLNAED